MKTQSIFLITKNLALFWCCNIVVAATQTRFCKYVFVSVGVCECLWMKPKIKEGIQMKTKERWWQEKLSEEVESNHISTYKEYQTKR